MSEEKTNAIAIEYLEHYKKVKYGMMPEWVWDMAIKALEQQYAIENMGEELRVVQKGIKNDDVLIGFNLAVAICNKHIGKKAE